MSTVESDSMDRAIELSAPFEEFPVESRFTDLYPSTIRPWKLPVPLRAIYSSLGIVGLKHPSAPPGKTFALKGRGFPSVLSVPPTGTAGPRRHWFVLTGAMDTDTPLPLGDAAFAYETQPCLRVDGPVLKTNHSGTYNQVHFATAPLDRATLSSLTARILELDSDSRILVRLSPRYTKTVMRLWRSRSLYQMWSAI